MNRMKRLTGRKILLATVALCAFGIAKAQNAQAAKDTLTLTLDKALTIALDENPTMKVAAEEIALKKVAGKEAWQSLLPEASIAGSLDHTIKAAEMKLNDMSFKMGQDGTNTANAGLSINLPLFAPAVYRTMSMTKTDIELAVEKSRASKLDLVNQVSKAYYQLMLAQDSYDVLLGSYKLAEDNFNIVNAKYEQEANDEKYDKDVERIQNLADSGAISEEEAEARKRAAKERTEAKNAELEKQKQEMARKQAIWEKATSVAQAGIATALAITEALPNIPLSIVIGAMGAIQVATILATPIPSYADGTQGNDRHPGGAALVGDAGKHEVIMYSGKAWITPDTPTLVDIPKGAQVFPDVDKVDISNFDIPDWDFPTFSPTYFASSSGDTIVFNDYSRLEKRVDRTNFLLMKSLKMQRQDASNREFELYKLSKLK